MKSILLTVFTIVICLNYQAATITSTAAGGNWNLGASWIGGIAPVAGDDVIIQAGSTVNLTSNQTCLSLTLDGILNFNTNTRTLTITTFLTTTGAGSTKGNSTSRNLNIGTSLTIPAGGSLGISGINVSVAGDLSISGTLTCTNAAGNKNFLSNFNINNGGSVVFNSTETFTISGNLNAAGTCSVLSAGSSSNGILNVGGNFTVAAATDATLAKGTINVTGDTDISGILTCTGNAGNKNFLSNFNINNGGSVVFNAAETYTISGNLNASGTCSIISGGSTGIMDVAGNFMVAPVAITTIGTGTINVAGLGDFNGTNTINSATGTINITGLTSINAASSLIFDASKTVNLNGGLETLANSTLGSGSAKGNVNVTGNTSVLTAGTSSFSNINLTVTGDLNINGTGILDATGGGLTMDLEGDWNNTSADADPFREGDSRITFNGSLGTQQISNLLGIENFYELSINNSSATTPALQTTVDINVDEDYDHTSGFLDLLGNNFTTGGASTGNQTFSIQGGGIISTIAGSIFTINSSALNILTVDIDNFFIGETTSEEITITITSERSNFGTSIFYGPMVVTKTGASNDDTPGGNTFFGPITFNTNTGGDRWRMGNTNPDIFHNLTINHDGNSNFILGRQTAGNEYHGTTNLNSSTAGGLFIGRNNVVAGTFSNEFFGPVNISVTLNGNVNFAESNATSIHNCIFNDVVTINSSLTSTGDVRFGSIDFGSTTFQNNGTLATGVIDGATNITFLNVTQTSGLPFTVNCTGNGTITCGNASVTTTNVFDGPISFTAPTMTVRNSTFDNTVDMNAQNFLFQTSTFNDVALLTKTIGGTTNTSNGGNVFNNDVTFTHNGTGQWSLGSSPSGDDYNGNVNYLRMNTGLLSMASTNTSTFAGNISTVGSSSNPLIATVSSGIAELDGNINQIIMGDIALTPDFGNLRINKSGGDVTLAVPINITSDINLTSGIMNTDATNLLIVNNGATRTGGSDASHVNGPMRKVGTNAFEFPVGKGGFWRPISITGPGVATDHFTAEFFNSDPDAVDAVDPAPMDAPIENISDCEYWILDRTNGSSNVSVTLSYRPYGANGCSGVTDLANLTIARWDGTTWVNHPSTGVGVPSGSITTNVAVTSFSPFALATFSTTNPLPIELINFTAEASFQNVLLNWQTASEINNDYFEIEKSTDGENFIPIQQVNGAGNSSQLLSYSTIDYHPFIGINYYRLKQTDFDGAFSYSDVKQVNVESTDLMLLYPNPAHNQLSVRFNDEVAYDELVLTDLTGKIIFVVNCSNKSEVLLDVSQLSKGVYFVTSKGATHTISQKLVVE